LGALQELVRLAVQTSTGQRSWLMLDIDGYRSSRRDELIRKAEDAIAEVKESGEEFAFKAMNSFERKIIHDQVAKAGLVSESEGEGDGRHVVVRPADD
ncbi:single-stranded DNA-binding protein, partial [Geobacillus sp. MMMUD3]|nr:single-stranded DNA-binding protein [Geobacillus sp. MMMUD3]